MKTHRRIDVVCSLLLGLALVLVAEQAAAKGECEQAPTLTFKDQKPRQVSDPHRVIKDGKELCAHPRETASVLELVEQQYKQDLKKYFSLYVCAPYCSGRTCPDPETETCDPDVGEPGDFEWGVSVKKQRVKNDPECKPPLTYFVTRFAVTGGDGQITCDCECVTTFGAVTLLTGSVAPVAPGEELKFSVILHGASAVGGLILYVSIEDEMGNLIHEEVRPQSRLVGKSLVEVEHGVEIPEHLAAGRYHLVVALEEDECDAVFFKRVFTVRD